MGERNDQGAPPGGGPPPGGAELSSIMSSFVPITALYHFDQFGAIRPYLGAGFAPVFSLAQRNAFNTGVTVDPTVGLVIAGGVDYMIDNHWGVSFDVKKLFSTVTAHSAGDDLAIIGIPATVPLAGTLKTQFDPWALSAGVLYHF